MAAKRECQQISRGSSAKPYDAKGINRDVITTYSQVDGSNSDLMSVDPTPRGLTCSMALCQPPRISRVMVLRS